MDIYIFNLLSIPVYALFFKVSSLRKKLKVIIFSVLLCIQFFLLASLRLNTVGADLLGYIEVFKRIAIANWSEIGQVERFEYGYLLWNKLLSLISDEERCLIVGMAVFTLVGFTYYIYRNSSIIWLSFFLFVALGYYTSSFNIYRQFMAMTILVNAIPYITKKQFWKFLLLVVSAACFHVTSVIFLFLYPLSHFKVSWTYLGIAFGIALIFGNIVAPWLLNYLIGNYFQLYTNEIMAGTGYGMLGLLVIVTVGGLLLRPADDERGNDIFYHIMIIACCLQIASIHFALFARVVLYFSINMIIFIPSVLNSLRPVGIKVMGIMIVCLGAIVYFYLFILHKDLSAVIPYLFFWE